MSSTSDEDTYHTALSSTHSHNSSRNSSSRNSSSRNSSSPNFIIMPRPEKYPNPPERVEREDASFKRATQGEYSNREAVKYPTLPRRSRGEKLSRKTRKALAKLTDMHGLFRRQGTSRIARDKQLADKLYERKCQAQQEKSQYDWKCNEDIIPGFYSFVMKNKDYGEGKTKAGIVRRKNSKRKSKTRKQSFSKTHRSRRSRLSRRQTRRINRRKPKPYGRSKSRKTKN